MTTKDNVDDPALVRAVDAWILNVLTTCGVRAGRSLNGALTLVDVPLKWATVIEKLSDGLHAATRGEELPDPTALK